MLITFHISFLLKPLMILNHATEKPVAFMHFENNLETYWQFKLFKNSWIKKLPNWMM